MSTAINPNSVILPKVLGDCTFVVIDDFLADPDSFREYAFELSVSADPVEVGVGYELHAPMDNFEAKYPGFLQSLALILHASLGTHIQQSYNLKSNQTRIGLWKGPLFNCVYKLPEHTPHVDRGHISSFIYLNPPEQCSGGTGIYRHIPTGNMRFVQDFCSLSHLNNPPLTEPLNYSAGDWELLHKFEMKYNRLVAFNASVIHKVFFEPEGHPYSADIHNTRLALNNFFIYS